MHPPSWLAHTPFAFWMVDALRPAAFVELGTQSGNSYASFAQAVQTLGLPTACYAVDTWRGDAQTGFYDDSVFTEWSAYHDRHFSAFSRLIRSTFAEAAEHFAPASIDLLHSDGCHTYDTVAADLELWRPKLSRRGVLLVHDINVREGEFGVWRLWQELKTQFPSFEFLHGHGLGVLGIGPDLPEPVQWLLARSAGAPDDVQAVRHFFARLGAAVSAQYAAAANNRDRAAELEPQVTSAQAQLLREREEHEVELRRKWQLAAELQDRVREEHEHRRRLEPLAIELQERLGQEHERRKQFETELRVSTEAADRLRREVQEYEQRIRRKSALVGDLQYRLRRETERRERLDAERAEASRPRRLRRRVASGWQRGIRALRRRLSIAAAVGLVPTARRARLRTGLRFLAHPARLREAHAVVATGLFDEAYYRSRYADVAASRVTPLAHFVLTGAREGRAPHPLFDTGHYLRCNPDVGAAAINPLLHYRTQGAFEGRSPHGLFDSAYYLEINPDVKSARTEPLLHFLTIGAREGRNPNPFFDCSYYVTQYPDVGRSGTNPLLHYIADGWREGRCPSQAFDPGYYLSEYPDVRLAGVNPLEHYLTCGQWEGRNPTAAGQPLPAQAPAPVDAMPPQIKLSARPLVAARTERPAVLCLSHVMPLPPRAGNEYRIYRLLRWLHSQGYRIVPVIAPLPGDRVDSGAVEALAAEFSNAVLCDRDGRVEYILRDVPDVLASLDGDFARPIAELLDEDSVQDPHGRQLLQMDRAFCHDTLITTALRLHHVLGSYILLSEYIWMSRLLPLITGDVLKVIDTIDVFSTKRQKVLQFGIDDLHVEAGEEAKRLRHADLVVAIQDEERRELRELAPTMRMVTAGVDFDVVDTPGTPSGRRVLYVASDNPMNRKGLSDFLRFAWPQIRRDVPDAELLVVGRISRASTVDVPGVVWRGPVDDLGALYREARLVINPAVAGTGLKIKTLEALGHLRPIVTWPNGTDGLPRELAALCITVQDWYDFSRQVATHLAAADPSLFSPAQRASIVDLTSPTTVYRTLTEAFDAFAKERAGAELGRSGVRV